MANGFQLFLAVVEDQFNKVVWTLARELDPSKGT